MEQGVKPYKREEGTNGQTSHSEPECNFCEAKLCQILRLESPPRRRRLERGERIDTPVCFKLWTVLSGLAAICTTLPDGRRQIVCLCAPGDLVCPSFGVDNAEVWIEALTPSDLCELELIAGQAGSWLGQDAAFGAELFRMAHNQVRSVSAHLVILGRLDAMERVCFFLSDMTWRIGHETPRGWLVRLPLSRGDMADYLGLNPETVSRILGRIKEAGLANFLSPTQVLVPDIQALQDHTPLTPLSATKAKARSVQIEAI